MRRVEGDTRTTPHARQGVFWRVLRGNAVREARQDDSPPLCKIDLLNIFAAFVQADCIHTSAGYEFFYCFIFSELKEKNRGGN